MFDLLSDVFETIRLKGTLYFRTDYSPPWAITVPAYEQADEVARCAVEEMKKHGDPWKLNEEDKWEGPPLAISWTPKSDS